MMINRLGRRASRHLQPFEGIYAKMKLWSGAK